MISEAGKTDGCSELKTTETRSERCICCQDNAPAFAPGRGMISYLCERCLIGSAFERSQDDLSCEEEMPDGAVKPEVFGPYVTTNEMGRGGQGIVFRAAHQVTGKVVALKTILPEGAGVAETLERFRREAAAASSLNHPHCLPIYEVGSSQDGRPFFSMRLARGGSLHHLRAKYRGRWRDIAELIIKIAKAVAHAHEKGVLHRDLKPGNILFCEDQEPLVADFGLAKHLSASADLTLSSTILGTPNYVSPEQASGRTEEVAIPSDIYSLGAIMFELLTGRPPFVGENPLDVLRQVATESVKRPRNLAPQIPKALDAICVRCLRRRPADRYQTATAVADDLQRWIDGRKITWRSRLWHPLGVQKPWSVLYLYCFIVALAVIATEVARTRAPRISRFQVAPTSIAVCIDSMDQGPESDRIAQQATTSLRHELAETHVFDLSAGQNGYTRPPSKTDDPLAFGRALNVRTVLTGCVRHSGERVRLVTKLLRCESGEAVWRHVETYAAAANDGGLQAAAYATVAKLRTDWSVLARAKTEASGHVPLPDAHMFYTRAMELCKRTNKRDLESAVLLFKRAWQLDPNYASDRAMLAFALWTEADTYGEMEKLPLALSAAKDALKLDPSSYQAHRVVASCLSKESKYHEALDEFWEALEMNPQSAGCCQSLAICLRDLGHPDQAIAWLERAIRIEPARGALSASLAEMLALCEEDRLAETALDHATELDGDQPDYPFVRCVLLAWQSRFEEASALCSRTRKRFPNTGHGLTFAAWIDFCGGKTREAERDFNELKHQGAYEQNWECYGAVNPASALALIALQNGLTDQSDSLAREAILVDSDMLKRYPHNSRILHDLAATFSLTGDNIRALEFFEQSISAGWVENRSTKIDPRFSNILHLARFQELLRQAASLGRTSALAYESFLPPTKMQ